MKWLDMKSKLYEIKNLEDGIKSKLDCTDLAIVSNQIEAHKERGGKKTKAINRASVTSGTIASSLSSRHLEFQKRSSK